MEYTKLGSSDLEVSRISLGTVFPSEAEEPVCLTAVTSRVDAVVQALIDIGQDCDSRGRRFI